MKKLALASALLLLPAAAHADGDYRYELTPHVSYHFGGDLEGEGTYPFEVEVDDGLAYGLTFDIPLSSNLQLEFLVNQQSSDLFFDGGVFGPDLELSEIDIAYAHVGLLVQFGRPAVSPYFVGSMGMTSLDADGRGAGSDTRFSASVGGGVKAFFTDHIGLRFEGRYFWTQLDDFGVDCDDVCYDARDYLTQFHTTVGLVFAW